MLNTLGRFRARVSSDRVDPCGRAPGSTRRRVRWDACSSPEGSSRTAGGPHPLILGSTTSGEEGFEERRIAFRRGGRGLEEGMGFTAFFSAVVSGVRLRATVTSPFQTVVQSRHSDPARSGPTVFLRQLGSRSHRSRELHLRGRAGGHRRDGSRTRSADCTFHIAILTSRRRHAFPLERSGVRRSPPACAVDHEPPAHH